MGGKGDKVPGQALPQLAGQCPALRPHPLWAPQLKRNGKAGSVHLGLFSCRCLSGSLYVEGISEDWGRAASSFLPGDLGGPFLQSGVWRSTVWKPWLGD